MRIPAGLFASLVCLAFSVAGFSQESPIERAIDKEAILDLTPVRYPTVVERGDAVIAASPAGVIYRSRDRGETWEPIASGLGRLAWEILYRDSRDALYVLRMSERSDETNKLLRSTDGGTTWRPVLELTNPDSRTMEIVEDAKGVLYLGEYSNQLPKTPYIYRSRDGAQWQRYFSVEGGKHIHSMSYNAVRDKVLFVLGDDFGISGVYESTADGFVQVNGLKILDVLSLANGLDLYLSDLGPGVKESYGNFIGRSDGLMFDLPFNRHGQLLFGLQSPATGVVYAGSVTGSHNKSVGGVDLWVSPDDGRTWGPILSYSNGAGGLMGYCTPRYAFGRIYIRSRSPQSTFPHFRINDVSRRTAWDLIRRQDGIWEDGRTYRLGFFSDEVHDPVLTLTGTAPVHNLAYKSSFEEDITWGQDYTRNVPSGTVSITDREARTGHRSMMLDVRGDSRSWAILRQSVFKYSGDDSSECVPQGTDVTLSFYARIPMGSLSSIEGVIGAVFTDGTTLEAKSNRHGFQRDWHRNSTTLNTGDKSATEIYYKIISQGVGAVYLDDVMVTAGHGCEPPTYVGAGAERTGDWTTHLKSRRGTGVVNVSIDERVFKTRGPLGEGEDESLPLTGLTLKGVHSFSIKVGGNHRLRYHITGEK